MPENSVAQNKTVVYLLAGVAALLAAIIGIMVWQGRNEVPEPTVQQPGSIDASSAAAAAANSPQPSSVNGDFDPKTATKVPAGKTPEEFLKDYYEAVKKGDYATAYECLPAAAKAGQDVEAFGQQLKGYGITGYSMDKPQTNGNEMTIVAYQETGYGAFGTQWSFVKDGDTWLVQGKSMAGMK